MNEEEKRTMENNIEEKFKNIKEKDILNNLTYAECLFILTPENKYGNEIKELSLLKLCEIVKKQQAEIEIHTNLEHQYKKEYLDIKEVAEKKDKFYKKLAEDNEFYAEEIEKKDRIIYSMSDLLNDGLREGIYINSEVGSIDFCMCNSREEVKQYFERKIKQ